MEASLTARAVVVAVVITLMLYVSGLLVILTPLPILYVSMSRGRAAGLLSVLFSAAAVAALYQLVLTAPAGTWESRAAAFLPLPGVGLAGFFPPAFLAASGIGTFGFFAAVAVALAEGARRRWDVATWGGVAMLAGVGVIAAVGIVALYVGPSVILQGMQSYALATVRQVVELHEASGGGSSQIALLADHAEEVASLIVQLLPAIFFVSALLAVSLNLVIGRRLIRAHHPFAHVHNVARFRLPDMLIWAVIAAGAAFFSDRYVAHTGALSLVAANALIALGAVYLLQGAAVMVYFLQGVRVPLVRTLAYVAMILFLQTVSVALVVLGVADVWANFRLRRWRALHHQE
jgi:hypothetical protein